MTYIGATDTSLEIARGNVSGVTSVNKFGRTTNADVDVTTDVWDGANPTTDQDIWVAPTAARVHAIVSTSTDDAAAGAGARTIQVYGLADWDTAESSETITMNGTTPVNTSGSYVIIHRMKVLTKGATDTNVGVITATAATDSTLTAQINASEGQTQMAIYGIPSTQKAYLTRYYASANRAAKTIAADARLVVNPEPDTELTNFLIKHTKGVIGSGTSNSEHNFIPYYQISGPAIIKLQVICDTVNSEADAGFDLILVDN